MSEKTEIYSIGYGGRSSEEFIDLLKRYEIALLVDVRSQPYSRFNPDFTQSALRGILQRAGIEYRFMGEALGGRPDDPDCFVNGLLNADKCGERPWYQQGIARLKELARQQRTAIMCSEKDPLDCHRGYTLGVTLAKEKNFEPQHINKTGGLMSQTELNDRLPGQQPALF